MSQTPDLIETSFLDAIAIIAAADELPKQTQRHWATSLRQIAKALDRPLEVIPARLSAIRADLARLHPVPTGLTLKTLRNHKKREERLAVVGAGKGHSRTRRAAGARMGEAAGPDQGSIHQLAAVVLYTVLLGERHCAR
jgi:hypothetical protein